MSVDRSAETGQEQRGVGSRESERGVTTRGIVLHHLSSCSMDPMAAIATFSEHANINLHINVKCENAFGGERNVESNEDAAGSYMCVPGIHRYTQLYAGIYRRYIEGRAGMWMQ